MKITRQSQMDFYAWNAGILNARRDYAEHPLEFNKRIYCSTCAEVCGRGRNCVQCSQVRIARRAKAKKRAA